MNKLQNDVNQYISKDAPEYLKDIVTKALATESSRIKKELLEDAAEKEPRLFCKLMDTQNSAALIVTTMVTAFGMKKFTN
jgi:hypothetical protein